MSPPRAFSQASASLHADFTCAGHDRASFTIADSRLNLESNRGAGRRRAWPPEAVLLACSLLWLPLANARFFASALEGRGPGEAATWGFAAALVVAVAAIHYLLLAMLAWGRGLKVVVTLALVAAAGASHFIDAYGAYIDPAMLRNALHTDWRESSELLGWQMLWPLLVGVALPAWWLWRVPLQRRSFVRATAWRLGSMVLAAGVFVGALMSAFQPLASLMRNRHELRYLITPANVAWSALAQMRGAAHAAGVPLRPVGRDAVLGTSFRDRERPALVVLVVGETARAANWGLNGYARQTTPQLAPPGLCGGAAGAGNCLDEGLLHGLERDLPALRGTHLLVLHQLGNHGPAYHRRVPAGFAPFQPACASDDLRRCSTEEIVNAYDNAIAYTDQVLARLIGQLQALAPRLDSALVYVSDHGESLGEHGLYLHGVPYAIAPDVQKRVPMLMWFSDGFARARGLDTACLARQAAKPASHDHLFHTVLGLLDVRTADLEPELDLGHDCTLQRAEP